MNKGFKIRIYQPNVRPYRVGLFEAVARRYPGRVKLCAAPYFDGDTPSCPVVGADNDYTHPYVLTKKIEWQKGFSLAGLNRGDVIVISGEPRNVSMMLLALIARWRHVGVVWWGLHKMPNQNRINLMIRKWIMKLLSTTILFYNKSGIEWLRGNGEDVSHVFATGNTINQGPIKAAINEWTVDKLSAFQKREEIVGKRVILACSRIIEKQRLHEAVEALSRDQLNRADTLLVVIGDGPLKSECELRAKQLGVNNRIRWLGAIYDESEIAPWFLSAKAFTYPGPVGLAILKSLSYGLPVVINDTHNSTEAEIMENGKTGWVFKESDIEDLAHTLDKLMADEVKWEKMSKYSKKVAYESYSMEQMVNNYCMAIEDAHNQTK